MLQTTFYKNDNFQGKYAQEWTDVCIELMTSTIFVETYKQSMFQLDDVTQHVEVTCTTPNGNTNYVPGP